MAQLSRVEGCRWVDDISFSDEGLTFAFESRAPGFHRALSQSHCVTLDLCLPSEWLCWRTWTFPGQPFLGAERAQSSGCG